MADLDLRRPGLGLGLAVALLAVLGGATALQMRSLEAENRQVEAPSGPPRYHQELVTRLVPMDGSGEVVALNGGVPFHFELEPGETLGTVLGSFGLEGAEAHGLSLELAEHVEVRRLKAGSIYAAYLSPDMGLNAFSLAVGDQGRVTAQRQAEQWKVSWDPFVRTVDFAVAEGTLDGALETAVRAAGAPAAVTFRMAEALQWDLDFNRDLRQGDHFRVLFEKIFLDGGYHSVGQVLAVQYENRGQLVEAYRFGDDGGLYDEEGRPLRKMFLRSPLPYSRVTSRFTHRRLHPVLKTYRPHYGVDYGAPTGTPIRVTANGTVRFAGWDRGGGKTVKVRHPNDFETLYLHMSRYAKGISPGRKVFQGDIIGYVGSTGLSTGPHLDYRIKHRGRYINPLAMKSVPAEPIPQKDLPAFLKWRDVLRASLEQGDPAPVLQAQQTVGADSESRQASLPLPGAAQGSSVARAR